MYLSFSLRVLIDAEALNMVESVGNYTRHRRAPMVVAEEGGYVLRYVPAISGEALAHAYQTILASLAPEANLPVCPKCAAGELVKHATKELFGDEPWEKELKSAKDKHQVEKLIVENCVVEDVGGFLYTDGNVRRTARVAFGYMVPSRAFYQATAVEPQFHVRHVPTQPERNRQMIYYVETASSVYVLGGYLDLCSIGCTSFIRRECVGDADRRRDAAVKALVVMLANQLYGAKRTRFLPAWTVASGVFALSRRPFMVTSAHVKDYIAETAERAKKMAEVFGEKDAIKVYYYYNPELKLEEVAVTGADRLSSIEELYSKLREKIRC